MLQLLVAQQQNRLLVYCCSMALALFHRPSTSRSMAKLDYYPISQLIEPAEVRVMPPLKEKLCPKLFLSGVL